MTNCHPRHRVIAQFLLLFVTFAFSDCAFAARASYEPPASPRATFNFNPDWRFIKEDVPAAEAPGFDDSKWKTVSTPHTYNDVDTFHDITHHGEWHEYTGIAWYRKHFRIPAGYAGSKVFLEFEGMKQAGRFFINGKPAGLFENGVTACGLDITDAAFFGNQENVLAVKIDNSQRYVEQATRVAYEWMSRDFDPNFGGINRNVWLHITGKVYQTLPLFENLKTTGIYVYTRNISVADRRADLTVECQVRNESAKEQSVDLSAVVVDRDGVIRATLKGEPVVLPTGEPRVMAVSGSIQPVNLWDDRSPYLYDVFTILMIGGKVVDVCKTTTGFRKTEFRGGAGKGGVFINDRFVYLKGYAQRSTNEWAGLGQAYPNWMHDFNAELIRGSHANYIRWMHISPQRADVGAFDKYGIVEIAPAGDKEGDAEGRQWEQRLEVMRDSMIYLRNHPSVLFWESGNNGISADHMKQMHDLRLRWDPNGGRAIGCRSIHDEDALPYAEYDGTMVSMDPRIFKLKSYTDMFRGYSDERRDRAPLIEAEDFRDEAARRFWDDYSPPSFGFHKKPEDTYNWNSETFCLATIKRYHEYFEERISNPNPKHSKWSGYASIIFADSNSHGRQYASEVCRVSGKVDAVRLPKEAYFTYRVLQNDQPDIHIIGHWSYPAGTTKTMYVVSNCDTVELILNGVSLGKVTQPTDGWLFSFPGITWQPGEIKANGSNKGKVVCEHTLTTSGPGKRIKLTPITGPMGLQADGSDVALIDVEVVDENGRRCPTDEARVDFTVTGPAIWRGGYNSGIPGSTNNLYLNTECGINRVAIRSTLVPGTVTITGTRLGLEPGTLQIQSNPVAIRDGLTSIAPQEMLGPLGEEARTVR